jgi:hypothetical protein
LASFVPPITSNTYRFRGRADSTTYSFDSSGENASPFGRSTSPVATPIAPVWPSTR